MPHITHLNVYIITLPLIFVVVLVLHLQKFNFSCFYTQLTCAYIVFVFI